MRRFVPLAALLLGLFPPSNAVRASSDYGCEPSWTLAGRDYNRCGNRAVLSPGNDTRVNLFFLLREQQGASPAGLSYPVRDWEDRTLGHNFFDWRLLRQAYYSRDASPEMGAHYGSRCVSLTSGEQVFTAAIKANSKLSAKERQQLAQARGALVQRCSGGSGPAPAWPQEIKSGPGREFLAYLRSADAFYGERWDASRQGFEGLRSARDPWVSETAAYMLGRVELNAAQATAFDEYGYFDGPAKVDQAALGRARAGFDAYLKRYGQGRYAGSARGLLRRAMWLAGDVAGLSREYERLLGAVPAAQASAADLVEEVDNKLLSGGGREAVESPLLLATIDLMLMREAEEGGPPMIAAAQLAAQESRFAGRTELFSFLTANHAYYVQKDMPAVLRLIPDEARRASYSPLAFSRQVLRGMALAALRDRKEAGFWRDLLGGANALYQRPVVELALAMNYERSGRLADVFASASPIGETAIREILLQYVAGPELLRAQARNAERPQHERDLALFTLLHKQLSFGNYTAYLNDSALVGAEASSEGGIWNLRQQEQVPVGLFRAGAWSDGYSCPALAVTARALARNARDVKARLCLGDFYRLNGFDDIGQFELPPQADELGGTASLFPGKPIVRSRLYADIIADPRAPAADKAYALFRAVNCYAPSGNNSCGGEDVDISRRRAWFQRLKQEFPTTSWAHELRYYW